LWLELTGEGPSVLIHLGMTGAVVVEGHGAMEYKSFKVRWVC
jgi:formamidopyrimidine-DNA glycosylase